MFATMKFKAFDEMLPPETELMRKRSEGRLKSNVSATDARIFSDDKEEQRKAFIEIFTKAGTSLGNYIPIHELIETVVNNLKGGASGEDELKKMIELQEKNEALLKEMESLKNIIADKENEIQHLMLGFESPGPFDQSGDAMKMVIDLRNEVTSLKAELAAKEKIIEDMKKLSGGQFDLGDLQQLQAERDDFKNIIDELNKKLQEEENKAKEYHDQLMNLQDATGLEKHPDISMLEGDDELKRLLTNAEGMVEKLSKDLKDALNELEVERGKNKEYEEKLMEAEKLIDELQKLMSVPGGVDLSEVKKDGNVEQEEINKLKELLKDTEKKNEDLLEQLKTLQGASSLGDDDKLKLITELQMQLAEQNKLMESAIENANDLKKQLEEEKEKGELCAQKLKAALEAGSLGGDETVKKINELLAELAEQKRLMDGLQHQLDEEKRKGEKCSEELKTALESMGDDEKAVKIHQLQSEIEDQKKVIEDLQKQLNEEKHKVENCTDQLKTALESTELGGDDKLKKINDLEAQIVKQKELIEELQRQLDNVKVKSDESTEQVRLSLMPGADDDKNKIRELLENIADLEKQLKEEKEKAPVVGGDDKEIINGLRVKIADLEKQLKEEKEKAPVGGDDKEEIINGLRVKIADLEKQLKEEKEKAPVGGDDKEEIINGLRVKITDLEKQLKEEKEKAPVGGDDKEIINGLRVKIADLEKQLNEEKEKGELCAQQLKAALESTGDDGKAAKIHQLQSEIEDQKKVIEDLQKQLNAEKHKVENCTDQLKTALESTELGDDDKLKKINNLEAQIVKQKEVIDELQRQLDNEKLKGVKSSEQALAPGGDDDKKKIKELLEKIKDLETELKNEKNKQGSQKLDSSSAEDVKRREITGLQSQLDDKNNIIKDLEKQLNAEKFKGDQCAEQLKTALQSTTMGVDDKLELINNLQKQLEDQKKLQDQVKEEKEGRDACEERLKAALESGNIGDDDKVKKILELQGQIEEQRHRIVELEKELKNEKEKLLAALNVGDLGDDDRLKMINSQQREILDLQNQLKEQKNKLGKAQGKPAGKGEPAGLDEQKKLLQKALADIKELQKKLTEEKEKGKQCAEQLKTALESSGMTGDDKLKKINSLQAEVSKLKKSLQDQINKVKDLEEELNEKGDYHMMGEQPHKADVDAINKLKMQLSDEEKKNKQLTEEVKMLKEQLAKIKEGDIKKLSVSEKVKDIVGDMKEEPFLATDQPWEEVWYEKPSDPTTKRINGILKLAQEFGLDALFMDDLKLLQGAIASALGLQEDPTVAYLAQKKNIKESKQIVESIYSSHLTRTDLLDIHQAVATVYKTLTKCRCR